MAAGHAASEQKPSKQAAAAREAAELSEPHMGHRCPRRKLNRILMGSTTWRLVGVTIIYTRKVN